MGGNKHLFEIFMACRVRLARAVSRIVPPHEIEDIVQETYVLVCRCKTPGKIRAPVGFMMRTARNLALDYIKRAEWRLTKPLDEEAEEAMQRTGDTGDQTFRQAASDEEFAQLCEAVRQLPLQCRRVFVLKKVYGYSQMEIAKELGLSENTVEKHIAKGVALCAAYIAEREQGAWAAKAAGKPAASVSRIRR